MEAEDQVFLVESTWMQPLFDYLTHNELPEDKTEACCVMRRSSAFTIHDGLLHKRSISDVLQRCVVPEERKKILLEIHQGPCGHHVGSRNLVRKAFRARFYWPTAELDAKEIVKHCEACQMFAVKPGVPATELHMIPLAWPFAQWGLDMVEIGRAHV